MLVGIVAGACSVGFANAAPTKPLLRDFMGVNGHYHFRPALYRPTCELVRNYHPMPWDLPGDTSRLPAFPRSAQKIDGPDVVDWGQVYGSWKKAGYRIDASLQFDSIRPDRWTDLPRDLYAYGKEFAKTFGPSSALNLVESAEIGNEPVNYDDAEYRRVFEHLAKGLRAGDPKLKIITSAAAALQPDKYSKSVKTFQGLEALYDVLNIHTYSLIEGWPTWRRVYPESPDIPYLQVIEEMAAWRDRHAPGKEIWVTEFGYDASTKPAPTSGNFSKWVDSSDVEQAQWIVRSFLLFSALPVERAYVYYYDDKDQPSFHASSGLTRNFQPKPSFWAMAHLYQTLGDHRFSRVVSAKKDELYVYEFVNPARPKHPVWVLWSPTGSQREAGETIPVNGAPVRAERMPLVSGEAEEVRFEVGGGTVRLPVGESPVYLFF